MRLTTTGMVRLSAVLFVVAAGLFVVGFAVADRAMAGSGDDAPAIGTGGAPTTAPTAVPDGGAGGPTAPGGAAGPETSEDRGPVADPTPSVVETRVVTVTAPPVTVEATPTAPPAGTATPAVTATPDPAPTDEEPAATTSPTTSPSQPAPTARPSTTPSGPPATGGSAPEPSPSS